MAKMTDEEIAQGLESNKKIFDELVDMEYSEALIENVLSVPIDTYFRVEKIGFEEDIERNNPERPVILICNHSGMAFPWDGISYVGLWLRNIRYKINRLPRPLVAKQLTAIKIMNPFMLDRFWERCGGVDASFFNFETMMHYPHNNILVFPEGINGIGKGFDKKYQLQRFATSFVRMALKYDTDIVSMYSVNGEYINPYAYSFSWINSITRLIGIPYIPIGFNTLFLPFCPWMFYFAMPAKLTLIKGKRIRPSNFTNKPYDEMTEEDIKVVRDKIAEEMQKDLTEQVKQHGQHPYQWNDFFKSMKKNWRYGILMFPIGWALLFTEFERQWKRYKKTGKEINMNINIWSPFVFLFRNPIAIFFYLPIVGWLFMLIKGYSKYRK